MQRLLIVVLLLVLSGCSTWREYNPTGLRSGTPNYVSMTGERRVARTGEYFLTSWPYAEHETIFLNENVVISGVNKKFLFGRIEMPMGKHEFTVVATPGKAVLEGIGRNGEKYFVLPNGVNYKYGGWPQKQALGGVVVPQNNQAGAPRVYWQPPENPRLRVSSESDSGSLALTNSSSLRSYEEFTGFGQTITFIGLAQGQIRFVYKEFQDSTIRNAFTQEFGFDFVPGQEYGYKDSRFIVHRASSTEIEYTVLSAFGK